MVPMRSAALALVLMSLLALLPGGEAAAAPGTGLPRSYDDIIDSPYFPQAIEEVDQRHQGSYALTYYAFGYMEARRNDWQRAWSGDATQLLSPEFTYLMAADADGRQVLSVANALTTWGTCTYAELAPAVHEYPVGDPAFWTIKVWSQAGERAWREAPEHRPMASYAVDYSSENLVQIRTLLLRGIPVVVNCYGLANGGTGGFLDDDLVVSSKELIGQSFSHFHTIVGYDDDLENDGERGAVRVMTSFGPDFGEGGSFWITYTALQAMADLHARDFTAHVDDAFLTYLDPSGGGPGALLIWEYDTPPTQDCTIDISLLGQDGGPVTAPVRPFIGSRWYSHLHHFPRFLCLDLSAWTSMLQWPEVVLRMDQDSTPNWVGGTGSIGCLVVEIYGDGYSSAQRSPPTMVSAQSITGTFWTPFRVLNDLTFQRTVPIAEAADSPGQRYRSAGVWTFYGILDRGAVGGSCLRTPESAFREETRLETEMRGPGTVTFRWRGFGNGVQGGLYLLIDGTVTSRLASETGWTDIAVSVPEGLHRVAWATRHEDEGSIHTLDDYYLLDNIQVHGSDDAREENDVAGEAAELVEGQYALTCADADWFVIPLNIGDGLRVEVGRSSGTGGLQLFLRMPSGAERQATREGDGYVLVLERANDFMNVRFCVRADDIAVSDYTLLLRLTRGDDPGSRSDLSIRSGSGAVVGDGDAWTIETEEGCVLRGSLTLAWRNAWSAAADLLLIPNWGDHSQAYETYQNAISPGNGTASMAFDDITAPKGAGTYWIFFAFRSGVDAARLASGSFDEAGQVGWNDGDDLADLGNDDLADIQAEGRAWPYFFGTGGVVFRVPVACAALQVIVRDVSPPVTSAALNGCIGEGCWYTSEVEVTLTAMDPSGIAGTRFQIDDGAWTSYTGPFRIATNGAHTLAYSSVDGLMHSEAAKIQEILIDREAPQIAISVLGDQGRGSWYVTPAVLVANYSDAQSSCSVRYRIDNGYWSTMAEEIRLQVSGEHVVEISCQDAAGNTVTIERKVDIDLEAPTVGASLVGARLNEEWYGGPVTAHVGAWDADSGMAELLVRLDGGEWVRCDGTYTIGTPGRHRLDCRAMDGAGNADGIAAVVINVDLRAPHVSIEGRWAGNGLIALDRPQVTLRGDDDNAVQAFFIRMDQGGWVTAREGVETMASGVHSVEAYAIDVAGRIGPILSTTVVFDPDGPVAELHMNGVKGGGSWYRGAVLLNVTATDLQPGPITLSLLVNGREVNPASFLLDVQGWHEIVYLARDRAGNVHGPFSVHIGIDKEGPVLSLTPQGRPGANGWYTSEVTVTMIASDSGSGIATAECNVDGTGWRPCNATLAVRYDGRHAVEWRCLDRAGNSAATRLELCIDSDGPQLPWKDGEELRRTDKTVSLTLVSGDWCSGLATLKASIDGAEPMPLSLLSPRIELGWLSDGPHRVQIEAQDGAGNVEIRVVTLSLNTDPFDPEGPYGITLLAMIVAAVLCGVALVVRRAMRNR